MKRAHKPADIPDSEPEINPSKLQELAKKIKPAKVNAKKGKKFADKSFMLSVVDSVNKIQEEKIQGSLEREAEILKRLTQREKAKSKKRETKGDKVKKMKERLQKKGNKKGKDTGKDGGKGKGDHRDFGNSKSKGKGEESHKSTKNLSGKPKKRVSFK